MRPIAVVIRGNPSRLHHAGNLYRSLQEFLEARGYLVEFDDGAEFTSPRKDAAVWIGHSRGADRLRFAPPWIVTIPIGSDLSGAINHPDDVVNPGEFDTLPQKTKLAHNSWHRSMGEAIDQKIRNKINQEKQQPMESTIKKSIPLAKKLDAVINPNPVVEEIDFMLSEGSFSSQRDLREYLTEGSLLNISRITADALSIPNGKYIVWATDAGHTMLVPIKERSDEVFESKGDQVEILTPELIGNWYGVSKCLAEELPPEFEQNQGESSEQAGQDETKTQGAKFKSKIDPADIDRNPMLRAMEQGGFTVTSLAHAVGVDPPMISRLLRTPKDRHGDPGGRNPSMGLASRLAQTLRMDVEALFPDIFGAPEGELGPRQPPSNIGSGVHGGSRRKGKATEKWTQGGGSP